jgi:hypothetical protein
MAVFDIENEIKRILRLRSGSVDVLDNRESSRMEFKKSFNLASKAKYAKSMASFANNRGGAIVFGVEPSPHRICGIGSRFEELDPVKLTEYLSSHFSPEIVWEIGTLEFHGVRLGFVYSHEAVEKPVMVTRSDSTVLREGEVYYRYKAQSLAIKYSEMRQLIDDRLERERRAWLQHLSTISRAGPTNIALLDTVEGKVHGGNASYMIDERLLRQLKFVREGKFVEAEGEPTLRLVGDLQPITGGVVAATVPAGIHEEDLLSAFLAQRHLSDAEARAYLVESVHQVTPYVPVFYFCSLSSLSLDETIDLMNRENVTFKATRKKIVGRLKGELTYKPLGTVRDVARAESSRTTEELLERIDLKRNPPDQRTLLAATLSRTPNVVHAGLSDLDLLRVLEAITNVPLDSVQANGAELRRLLFDIYRDHFATMDAPKKLAFRKGVTYLDEAIFGNACLT